MLELMLELMLGLLLGLLLGVALVVLFTRFKIEDSEEEEKKRKTILKMEWPLIHDRCFEKDWAKLTDNGSKNKRRINL